ncbi:MAG: isoleucine--tRNA ligase [Candidatus Omnitrophota bacterium]
MNYKETLNLPKTNFSMQANLSVLEPKILNLWGSIDIYGIIRKQSNGRAKFILHDGPPYANGNIHIGHALNKILKDFVVKFKTMQGFNAPFVPGWDCHGLPIEHQLFKELGITKYQISKLDFRKKAKDFTLKFVDIQKKEFEQLGILADWEHPYLTLNFPYEAEIIRVFAKLTQSKHIYRGLKPINWCINCETALAEAEVEYEERRSPSIYVKFPLLRYPEKKRSSLYKGLSGVQLENTYFVIWTTTPWTLISNAAIAANPKFKYCLVEAVVKENAPKQILIIEERLVDTVMHQAKIAIYQKIGEIPGAELENLQAKHPFLERKARLVLADYVSQEEGSGFVHIAPGHGQEDYQVGLKYNLPVIMPVNEKGMFDSSCGEFSGIQVFQANDLIITKMSDNGSLLHTDTTAHSYPHCWRCKRPLITRSTKQWFMNVDHKCLRKQSLKAVQKVQWIPKEGQTRITSMLEERPDWCLSRQRFWGVPIPVFYCAKCGREVMEPRIMERIAEKIHTAGSDVWFEKSPEELIGEKIKCVHCQGESFVKEEDIIDVWFDSGISHQAVLEKSPELAFPASLYLEGSDQHRGWFQTAILTSIPLTGKAPYKKVLTHGFVVDGEGKKMSKSGGNVISPQEVITKYGAEILRLWVASCDYTDDIRISPHILASTADAYRKIRNTLRFILGNLYDFTPRNKVKFKELREIDRWALSALSRLVKEVTEDFEQFHYYKTFRRIYNFCVQEMSSFYLDILKDRLYTSGKTSAGRRSAQTVLCEILTTLTKILTPIITFTAEEIWGYLGPIIEQKDKSTVMLNRWPKITQKWIDPLLDDKFRELIRLRNIVLKAIENEREKGRIHSSLEAKVLLYINEDTLFKFLQENQEMLSSIFIVSAVSLEKTGSLPKEAHQAADISNIAVMVEKIKFLKCERCWNYKPSVGENPGHTQLCAQCAAVLEEQAAQGKTL